MNASLDMDIKVGYIMGQLIYQFWEHNFILAPTGMLSIEGKNLFTYSYSV